MLDIYLATDKLSHPNGYNRDFDRDSVDHTPLTIRSQTGTSANYWLFTGEQRDSESGYYYLRARYYDQAIGRFIARDPKTPAKEDFQSPARLHLFAYVTNNPVNLTDPTGECIFGAPCPGPLQKALDKLKDALEEVADKGGDLGEGLKELGEKTLEQLGENEANNIGLD